MLYNDDTEYKIRLLLKNYAHIPMQQLTNYDEAIRLMNKHVWTSIKLYNPPVEPMAFVKKSGGDDGVYEIYVNPSADDETEKGFLLHEFGHVLFSHLEMTAIQKNSIINKICGFWPAFKNHFTSDAAESVTDLAYSLLNIAQDMEVNGKLFSKNEWNLFQYNAQRAYIEAALDNPGTLKVTKLQILRWFNVPQERKRPLFSGYYPEDFGFPCNLDYQQYVDLILMNNDRFFYQLQFNLDKYMTDGIQQKRKLTTVDIEKIRNQCRDAQLPSDWTFLQEPYIEDKKNFWKRMSLPAIDIRETKELENFILKKCLCTSIKNSHDDTMYFYNRRKYSSELLISKQTTEELYRPGNLFLLADCSGSVSYDSLEIIIKVVRNIARKLQLHSRIIWWSDMLNGDQPLKKVVKPELTGNTNIASGIAYVRENYLKNSNDKLIIISDYEDSLLRWHQELEKIMNDCVGICWRDNLTSDKKTGVQEYLESVTSGTEDEKIIPHLLSKLPTILVNI